MWSALNRVVVLKITQNLIRLTYGVSKFAQSFRDCAVDYLDHPAAHEPLVLDQGNIRLDARSVAVHHERDRPRRRNHRNLGVLEAEPLTKRQGDRKSTRLNSSHSQISYAVFCLKKKKNKHTHAHLRD